MARTLPLLTLLRAAILSMTTAILASGCANHVDHTIVIRLHVSLPSHEGGAVSGAAVGLRDRRFSARAQPNILRNPVCITNSKGECSAIISYRYGSTNWLWSKYVRKPMALSERFELCVSRDGRFLVRERLKHLEPPHIQGERTLFVKILL